MPLRALRIALGAVLLLTTGQCQKPAAGPAPTSTADDPNPSLSFLREGRELRRLSLREMGLPQRVTTWDPYYQKIKTFLAVPLPPVLLRGFGQPLRGEHLILRARDGYTVPISYERLAEAGGHLAFAEADSPSPEPIGPQRADPRPFYLLWTEPEQRSLDTHPRPWQLVAIEHAKFESVFPHVSPRGLPEGDAGWRGLSLFRELCIRCHAMNREGGRVGPDLNVPLSIVEYRPEPQIRAYILDPTRFRYGNMPSHSQLTESDLDALLAYFHAMKTRKHLPAPGTP